MQEVKLSGTIGGLCFQSALACPFFSPSTSSTKSHITRSMSTYADISSRYTPLGVPTRFHISSAARNHSKSDTTIRFAFSTYNIAVFVL